MAMVAKLAKRERPSKSKFRDLFENLRSQMTWLDLLAGLGAAVTISILLIGFRYQNLPEYKVGDIADRDVRALQEVVYEDVASTAQKREAARAGVPAVYELDTDLVANLQGSVSKSFAEARDLLSRDQIQASGRLGPARVAEALIELERQMGTVIPSDVIPILLKHRFSAVLEGQILRVLGVVLRDGIVKDRGQFENDLRSGILLLDGSSPAGRLLSSTYMVRNLPAARDYLRQFQLEFSGLAARDRGAIIELLGSLLVPTLLYDEKETKARRDAAAAQVAPVEIRIKSGKSIVRSGEEVTQNIISQLEALGNLQRPRSLIGQFLGFFFFVAAMTYALWRYFVHYQSRHRKIRNHTLLILLVITGGLLVVRLMTSLADILSERLALQAFQDPLSFYYAIPFAAGGILVTLLVDTNLGIVSSIMLATLSGLFYGDAYLAAYALLGNLAGIYSVRQYKDRAAILKAGLTIGLVCALSFLGIDLIRQVRFTFSVAFARVGVALLSGILASALASMLLPALESLFKITTDIRLLEMSNLNATILRRLSVEAPGTYHHSLMIGTLAEAAAEAIGANPLLVRVAAYYHDIGKILKPEYFGENQAFGMNKHESLSPSMSCLILASHVKDGLELAKEVGLPQRIADTIPQHHGTRLMTYFYQKAKDGQDSKNPEVAEEHYRYPGPKPQTKEAAILMMADSVEAASRTLSNPTAAQIQGMINRLVDAIVADNQLDECDITLREVRLVKESFLKILTGIFHRRIDYPGYDFKTSGSESERPVFQNSGPKPAKAV